MASPRDLTGCRGLTVPWLPNVEIDGSGQRVTICDSGLDKGNPGDMHPAFRGRVGQLLIPALNPAWDGSNSPIRVVVCDTTAQFNGKDEDGHGTFHKTSLPLSLLLLTD